jgi:hypothetical protein
MALPDDRNGVPRIIQSGSEGQTGFCYFLACVELSALLEWNLSFFFSYKLRLDARYSRKSRIILDGSYITLLFVTF